MGAGPTGHGKTLAFAHGFIGTLNHLANKDYEGVEKSVVTELTYREHEKGDSYYLHTTAYDSTELKLRISSSDYFQLSPGSEIIIYYGEGALGIKYAYLVDIP